MSGIARTIQSMRPHVPLIRFPGRFGEAAVTTRVEQAVASSVVPVQTRKPVKSTNIYTELPARYRRQHMSEEEMGYIERGGPE